jgi:hypothetical protein
VYHKGANRFFRGQVDWIRDDIMARFVGKSYQPDFARDEFLSDIPKKARVGRAVELKRRLKEVAHGHIDAGDVVVPHVPESAPVAHGLVIYQQHYTDDRRDEDLSPLLFYFDGTIVVTVAETAPKDSNMVRVDPLWGPLAAGTVLNMGDFNVTLTRQADARDRRLHVEPLEAPVPVNTRTRALVAHAGFPMKPRGDNMIFVFDDGPNRIVRL